MIRSHRSGLRQGDRAKLVGRNRDFHVVIVEAVAAANADAAEKAIRDDAKFLFDQLHKHLFKDQLRGADFGALTQTLKSIRPACARQSNRRSWSGQS
jgi:hypothetical protein